jgi:lipopolysaccharide export system protein LptA
MTRAPFPIQLAVKLSPLGLVLLAILLRLTARLCSPDAWAQVSVSGRGKDFVAPVTDAQGRKSVLRGAGVTPIGRGLVEITNMQAVTYRGQEKDMIVEAPLCVFDTKANVATSAGRLAIRTVDERFSIQGRSFQWQMGDSRLSSKLVISNEVQSLVRKRLLTSTTNAPAPAGPRPGPTASTGGSNGATNQFIAITSKRFQYEGDSAVYRGKVHAHDSEGDLDCELLRVLFKGENAGLERIEAEQEVVVQQGTTRAMADKAVYTTDPDNEIVEFQGHAIWQEGDRLGSGERVSFDRRKRVLHAEQNAYLKLPRSVLGDTGLLSATPGAAPVHSTNAASGFVEVFSDLMTMQLPETNGPVQQVVAEKNVLIVEPEENGRALADRAVYTEASGILELTGSPMIESERRLVNGRILRFDRATSVFTAAPDAYVKLPFQAAAELTMGSSRAVSDRKLPPAPTNQFIEVWAKTFEYHTNRLRFQDDVRANFLEGDVARGKLTCASLLIRYGEQIESITAETAVELEQFPPPTQTQLLARRVNCEVLNVKFTSEGRLDTATADHGVSAEQEERRAGRPQPVHTRITAETVTAFFRGVTNRLDHVVADQDVVFAQDERMAHGAKAVYTDGTGLLELTGQPSVNMPDGQITNAERLVWDRLHGRVIGRGKFRSEWKRPPGSTNQLKLPFLSTEQSR